LQRRRETMDGQRSFRDGVSRREFLRYTTALGLTTLATGFPRLAFGSKHPVKIGISMSVTGRYADTGKYLLQGYQLWVKHVNARGGLLGQPVELIYADDKSDPQTGIRLYSKLITEDKVEHVFGPYSSAVTEAVTSVTERHGYPMLAGGASSEEIWEKGRKYIFGSYTPAAHYLDGALDIAKKQGYKKIVAVNENTLFPKQTIKGALEQAKRMGFEIVFQEEYPKAATDLTPLLTKVKTINPDVLLAGSYLPDAKLLTSQLKEVDYMPKVFAVTVGAALDDFGNALKKDAEYVLGASQWEPHPGLPFPGIKKFIEDFQKEFGRLPSYHAASGYMCGEVLEAAVKKTGSQDREKIRQALSGLDMMTMNGRYKVDNTGLQIGHEILLIQWLKGKKEIVWPEKYATAKWVVPIPPWKARG